MGTFGTQEDNERMKRIMAIPGKHRIIKFYTVPPVPGGENREESVNIDEGVDSFGIRYKIKEDVLTISTLNVQLDPSFVDFISNLPNFVKKIVIKMEQTMDNTLYVNYFNNLCSLLEHNKSKAKIILDISSPNSIIKRNNRLDFEKLPSNVFVSNHVVEENGEERKYLSDFSTCFNTWMLWLSDEEFFMVINKLTPNTKIKSLREAKIAEEMYLAFKKAGVDRLSDHDKVLLVFNWCMKNARYSFENLKPDGNLKPNCEFEQDSVSTYKRGKGVCKGRANLMKLLLNNRYMRVNCFLENGCHGRHDCSLGHIWNVVFYHNGDLLRYDLSYGIQDCKQLPSVYFNARIEESVPSDVESPMSPPSLPRLVDQRNQTLPPLPKMTDRRKLTPPPLPEPRGRESK